MLGLQSKIFPMNFRRCLCLYSSGKITKTVINHKWVDQFLKNWYQFFPKIVGINIWEKKNVNHAVKNFRNLGWIIMKWPSGKNTATVTVAKAILLWLGISQTRLLELVTLKNNICFCYEANITCGMWTKLDTGIVGCRSMSNLYTVHSSWQM